MTSPRKLLGTDLEALSLEILISRHLAKYQNTILHKDQEFLREKLLTANSHPLEKKSQYKAPGESPRAGRVTPSPLSLMQEFQFPNSPSNSASNCMVTAFLMLTIWYQMQLSVSLIAEFLVSILPESFSNPHKSLACPYI